MLRIATITLLAFGVVSGSAFAADTSGSDTPDVTEAASVAAVARLATRPPVLVPLYVSFAALNAYDAYSTRRGVSLGAREANAFMSGVAGNTAGTVSIKAVATALPILVAEGMWRDSRARAILVMVVANGAMAAVAANNARALNRQR